MKTSKIILMLLTIPFSAQAGFQGDVTQKLTELLSHPPAVMNVLDAQRQGLDQRATRFQPWSASYWPDLNGNIAVHYRDHSTRSSQLNFFMTYPISRHRFRGVFEKVLNGFQSWDKETLGRKLSPAEKYDLLLGDTNFTLTQSIMDELDFRAQHKLFSVNSDGTRTDESAIYQGDGRIGNYEQQSVLQTANPKNFVWAEKGFTLAYWSGICDGWSPAALHLPRPVKPVTLIGAKGHPITFFPEDIKALGSYLFARTNTPYFQTMNYQFSGMRCDEKGKPNRDGSGIVEDMRCNDVDAGVFHAVLLNRIGKDRIGFVMDIDNNVKVNNHPVFRYALDYYSPLTNSPGSLQDSIVSIDQLPFDGFAERRNSKTRKVVGVRAKIDYLNYIWVENRREWTTDAPEFDKVKTVEYEYDLELDEQGNIVGGEWGNRTRDRVRRGKVRYAAQPDFIWMGAPNALAYSTMSPYATIGSPRDGSKSRPFGNMDWAYDGKSLPGDWLAAALKESSWKAPVVDNGNNFDEAFGSVLKSAQPLSHLVYYLFDQARDPKEN